MVKIRIGTYKDELYLGSIIFFVALIIGGLGQLYTIVREHPNITYSQKREVYNAQILSSMYQKELQLPGVVMASKNGTRYYYPWCGGGNRIKEKNKVWFSSREQAERVGYTKAKGCEEF